MSRLRQGLSVAALVALAAAPAVPEAVRLLGAAADASVLLGCRALEALGPDAAPAVPALAGLVKGGRPRLAAAAAKVLVRIGPKAAPRSSAAARGVGRSALNAGRSR